MSMEQLLGTPFKQQDVWVWGSRDVPGGRAGKCLARDCGRRAWFSASALAYGNILLPWLTSVLWSVRVAGTAGLISPLQHTTGWRSSAGTLDWAAS